ncbi:MAG: hypothetical protein K6T65_07855 [Peptococcaceae bacterium]|nr:hypothetical protein [Peptococcaceae bacterium]
MKLHIKNQLNGIIEFCCGEKEYELNPEQEITIEVKDEDCMYFDTVHLLDERCQKAEKLSDGKCRGYQKSRWDDEPSEKCKRCSIFELFEIE